jgi:hypothetical protein
MSERLLKLTTDNPHAEILLLDGGFRVLKRGPTPLTHSAAPGLYLMKVKVGDQEREEILVVEPEAMPFEASLPAPSFESPIPLTGTSTTHEYHEDAVRRLLDPSAAATMSFGTGSAVMVCVRDPLAKLTTSEADRAVYAASFNGFRILDRDGTCIVNLDENAERNMAAGYIAITVDLRSGWYALAHQSGTSWVCTPLPTAGGLVLQVYINVVPSGQGPFSLMADLSGMAVVFDRLGHGFVPWRRDWLAGETVRQGMLEGRNYIDTPSMRQMLTGNCDDPMLGLYAAHLLLAKPTPDWPLIQKVLWNVEGLLGSHHPDVVALWAAYEQAAPVSAARQPESLATRIAGLEGPPLLARSWDMLVRAANRDPVLLTSAERLFKLTRDLVPNGVFLTWRQRTLEPKSIVKSAPSLFEVIESALPSSPPEAEITSAPPPMRLPIPTGAKIKREGRAAREAIAMALRDWSRDGILESISDIDSNEKASNLLWALAEYCDWPKLLPELRKNSDWIGHLSGVQRDLLSVLRDASSDPLALDGLNADFIEQLLQTYQVPLFTLVNALKDMVAPLERGSSEVWHFAP